MKNFTLIICSLWSLISLSQNVFVGDVILSNQTEVVDFASNQYDGIDGRLILPFNSSVTDLSPLSSLKFVTEDITINNAPQIVNLSGFNNITEVGGDLTIYTSQNLVSLSGLDNIIDIGGSLDIANTNMEDISALAGLENIGGFIRFDNNNSITTLEGLNSLSSIGSADAPTTPGNPGGDVANASVIVVSNNQLSDCCLLNRILSLATGVVQSTGNNSGCSDIIEIENSISDCAISLFYPRNEDVYVAGRNIGIFYTLIPIVNNLPVTYEYSIDNGNTWVDTGIASSVSTNELNSEVYIEWSSINQVTQPTSIQVRLRTIINGDSVVHNSGEFEIHPSNFYESNGFRDVGVSEIDFPLSGTWGEITVFEINENIPTHKCIDEYSRDYYDGFVWSSQSCNRPVFSPISGTVIYINSIYDPICDELDDTTEGYGNEIIIQSSIDKTFAFRIAHLNSMTSGLDVGSEVTLGDEIATTGGTSGQEFPHAHCTLYKNIYEWVEYFPSEVSERPGSTIDGLRQGFGGALVVGLENTCTDYKENFAAEYIFINGDINDVDTFGDYFIVILDHLSDFADHAYTSIFGNLTIEIFFNNLSIANSLDELISLRVIDGDLIIRNTNINSLDGLDNLAFVTGDLIIEDNPELTDFCALRNLVDINGIGGEVMISGNAYNPSIDDILLEKNCELILSVSDLGFKKSIKLFPNPFRDEIEIDISSDINVVEILLYDLNGKSLDFEMDESKLNPGNLNKGMYFIVIEHSKGKEFLKIIKN